MGSGNLFICCRAGGRGRGADQGLGKPRTEATLAALAGASPFCDGWPVVAPRPRTGPPSCAGFWVGQPGSGPTRGKPCGQVGLCQVGLAGYLLLDGRNEFLLRKGCFSRFAEESRGVGYQASDFCVSTTNGQPVAKHRTRILTMFTWRRVLATDLTNCASQWRASRAQRLWRVSRGLLSVQYSAQEREYLPGRPVVWQAQVGIYRGVVLPGGRIRGCRNARFPERLDEPLRLRCGFRVVGNVKHEEVRDVLALGDMGHRR